MSRLQDALSSGRPYFIAEMSANHENDLDRAFFIVDAASRAGADCLKVQTYTADTITLDCDKDDFIIKGGLWDGRRLYDLYDEASFPWEWHAPVKERCEELGMDFLSTPFDETAVDMLFDLGVSAFKIASFEIVDLPLIKHAASRGLPMIISTGMASEEEIAEAVDTCKSVGNSNIILLRCQSDYPADPATMNLATIPAMHDRFGVPVGFSDHSLGHEADVIAAALGAVVIEKHFCMSRESASADAAFSMTPDEYRQMVDAVLLANEAIGVPMYGPTDKERGNLTFRRSIFACASIKRGERFTIENMRIVRPATGAKPKHYEELLGMVADRDYDYGDPIVYDAR